MFKKEEAKKKLQIDAKLVEKHYEKKDISTVCICEIDEIVVFDDKGEVTEIEKKKVKNDEVLNEGRVDCLRLTRILQYFECPQYLRKYFFPIYKDLQYAGVLNPVDVQHHLRQQDVSAYREGVVINKSVKAGNGSHVNVGLFNDILYPKIPKDQPNPTKLDLSYYLMFQDQTPASIGDIALD